MGGAAGTRGLGRSGGKAGRWVLGLRTRARGTAGCVVARGVVRAEAEATPEVGRLVAGFAGGESGSWRGRVVWRGTPGGRDDAALVEVDDPRWRPRLGTGVRWGRVVTNR